MVRSTCTSLFIRWRGGGRGGAFGEFDWRCSSQKAFMDSVRIVDDPSDSDLRSTRRALLGFILKEVIVPGSRSRRTSLRGMTVLARWLQSEVSARPEPLSHSKAMSQNAPANRIATSGCDRTLRASRSRSIEIHPTLRPQVRGDANRPAPTKLHVVS